MENKNRRAVKSMTFYQKASITMSGCGSCSGIASSYVNNIGFSFTIPVVTKDIEPDIDNKIHALALYYSDTLKALSE